MELPNNLWNNNNAYDPAERQWEELINSLINRQFPTSLQDTQKTSGTSSFNTFLWEDSDEEQERLPLLAAPINANPPPHPLSRTFTAFKTIVIAPATA